MAIPPTDNGSLNLSLQTVADQLQSGVEATQNRLQEVLASVGDDPSAMDLVEIQAAVQEWTLSLNLDVTIIKTLHDSMNEIIQKTG